ncbi:MAG: glycosyltransferase [Dongiales bacterium]
MRILLTNWNLNSRGGTESVIRDIALGLRARDHIPVLYATSLGPAADELKAAGIPVTDDLARIGEAPDIIHAHHFFTTGEALIRFPRTPAIQVCHGWGSVLERPPRFPQIRRYVAVSDCTRDNIVNREGIAPERATILPNAVDLTRIPERPDPLPERPGHALAFTSQPHLPILPALRDACQARGISLATMGLGRDDPLPERTLVACDLVFATGRSAIEALCAGCAVITCDVNGLGGLVTPDNYDRFRRHNFALRSLVNPVTAESVGTEIDRYDRPSSEAVSARMRAEADLDIYLDRLIELYHAAIEDHRAKPAAEDDIAQAVQRFLHESLPRWPHDGEWGRNGGGGAQPEADPASPPNDMDLRVHVDRLMELYRSAIEDERADRAAKEIAERVRNGHGSAPVPDGEHLARLEADLAAHRAALAEIRGSTSWRISAPLRWIGRALGRGRGAGAL